MDRLIRSLVIVAALLAASVGLRAQTPPAAATVTPLVGASGAARSGAIQLALQVELPEGLHANSNAPRDPMLIAMTLDVEATPGVTVREIVWPPAIDLVQDGAAQPLAVFERTFVIGVAVDVAADAPLGDLRLPLRLRYQACDEKICYFPRNVSTEWIVPVVAAGAAVTPEHADVMAGLAFGRGAAPIAAAALPDGPTGSTTDSIETVTAALDGFDLAGSAAGQLGTDAFLEFIYNAENGIEAEGWFEGRGPIAIILLVLVGGLALNLTPCVLPMIPINLAIIGAGAQAGSRGRGFLLGAAYGAAMAVVYGLLGLIVILTASTFGTINANPWFNVGIAALFVVLALAMFDVIVIDFSRLSNRFRVSESGRGTFLIAFGMGAVAALLAGACVAPVVIQVVLFSSNLYATGTAVALALPFLLGVGMALPWPIAGAGIAALPKPGAWMVRVKQAFGVFILGTAIYYGYTGYTLFANRWVDPEAVASSVQEKLKEGWHASLAEGLTVAARENKPVLVDLWATWCKNCLVMDATTLASDEVTTALEGYVKVKFQAEDPGEPLVAEVMSRFGAIGLPTYVILQPRP
jgi:thiol:disulfide interchange protein